MAVATATHEGKIIQVIGSTFDAEFEEGHLPEIYNALKIDSEYKGVPLHLTGEVQQHLGGNRVRQAQITKEIAEVIGGAEALKYRPGGEHSC